MLVQAGLSVRDVLAAAVEELEVAGVGEPRTDAEVLLAAALGTTRAQLNADSERKLDGGAADEFERMLGRRLRREPVAYILGHAHFRELELVVDGRVLIPRPETELLVEVGLELAPGSAVHDVGTGSGAVALALLDERPDLAVSASDVSAAAVDVALANAARLELPLDVVVARGVPRGYEGMILANLPYVREDEWPSLAPEIVRWEPREALVSGADGLDAIRSLVAGVAPGTRLALEHAPGQAEAVRALLRDAETRRDLAGRERVTVGLAP